MESDALEKQGHGRWSIRHRVWKALLAQVVMQSIVFLMGGWAAVAVVLAGMAGARVWVESFHYFQPSGLVRVDGVAIAGSHVWNNHNPLSRVMGFELNQTDDTQDHKND